MNSYEKKSIYEVIDLNKMFKGQDGLLKVELTTDGTHLNDAGYDLWVKQIEQFIN